MSDNESPDHAGLRSDAALDFAKQARLSMSYQAPFNQDEHLAQWFIKVYANGRASQEAEVERINKLYDRACEQVLRFAESEELAKQQAETQRQMFLGMKAQNDLLQADATEKDREIAQMAAQIQELSGQVERLKEMVSYRNDKLAVLLCDCGTSTLMPDKRKAMIYHQYECAYRQFVARREGEPALAQDGE